MPDEMPDADRQAANFQRVREAHQTELAEDYVELIADLIDTTGEARAAERCKRRHEVVVRFLCAIGVDEETAERDAEGIEHHVSEVTLAAFERVTRSKSLG
jgi:DtxR family manganese transport transcriptional regulator